jgi:hypothetical protein
MTDDARFEDVSHSDQPLRLSIESPEDLDVASALIQDAVGLAGEISWMPRRRRLAVLVNRFRWEDRDAAVRQRREYERVRTAVVFDSVLAVRASGLDPREKDMVYSILRVSFEPGEDGAGTVTIDLAGDGAVALDVECLDARVLDLSRPWVARAEPGHELE